MNPLLSIWLKPRETIRQLSEAEPSRPVMVGLAVLVGLTQVFNQAVGNSVGAGKTLPVVLLAILLVGPAVGLVWLYLGGAVLQWAGGQFGGQGTVGQYRGVMVWTALPLIATILLFVPEVRLFGLALFVNPAGIVEAGDSLSMAFFLFGWAEFILAVWTFVLLVLGIAQVSRVSLWLAIVLSIVPTYIGSTTASIVVSVVGLL